MDSSKAPDHLEFRGEDAEECYNFISAVIKYAYCQGKQGDDKWITDFVATCLKGDALRWWTSQNTETRGNWDKLKNAMAYRFRPSFYGKSGAEAEDFVHSVLRRALDSGKQGDNGWIVDFVPVCFKGDALRWYSSLDLAVQKDWNRLQEAIFRQYPQGSVTPIPKTTRVPAAILNSASSGSPFRRGRILLRRREVSDIYYLSRTLDSGGNVLRTRSKDDALEVEYDSTCDDFQELIIPEGQVDYYDRLAIQWSSEDFVKLKSSGALCFAHSKTGVGSQGPTPNTLSRKAWMISRQLSPHSEHLTIIPTVGEGNLHVQTPDESDCVYFYAPPSRNAVWFFFEPL